jgi:hypothetical protein
MLCRMTDLPHSDPVIGRCLLTFDGRVLELFTEREGSKSRMIVGLLHVTVQEPNRKGRREVKFTGAAGGRGGGFAIWALDEQWSALEPFIREVRTATGR